MNRGCVATGDRSVSQAMSPTPLLFSVILAGARCRPSQSQRQAATAAARFSQRLRLSSYQQTVRSGSLRSPQAATPHIVLTPAEAVFFL